jgi:hypothetical protein
MTEAQIRDQLPISLQVLPPEVVQKTTATADHLEESPAAVVIFLMPLEVIPEVIYALRQESDLYRGTAPVTLVELVLLDDLVSFVRHSRRPPQESALQGKPLLLGVSSNHEP